MDTKIIPETTPHVPNSAPKQNDKLLFIKLSSDKRGLSTLVTINSLVFLTLVCTEGDDDVILLFFVLLYRLS